jgi:hypothetical protein
LQIDKAKTSFLPHFQPLSPSGLSPEGKEKGKEFFKTTSVASKFNHKTTSLPHFQALLF